MKRTLELDEQQTFYSNAISASYFSIFYAAKAYLLSKGIKITAPREHEQTYERFSWFIETGVLDKELLAIYDDLKMKAKTLLNIFKEEKGKRGKFTYRKLSQANKLPAEESVKNARKFFTMMYVVVND
ncbi:HEPN domain-containing protein [Candidatus Woesearchaeota archaeon]|nr:HEPN domain-containing protein [Candidatus Woesearchaeota archaeon]